MLLLTNACIFRKRLTDINLKILRYYDITVQNYFMVRCMQEYILLLVCVNAVDLFEKYCNTYDYRLFLLRESNIML